MTTTPTPVSADPHQWPEGFLTPEALAQVLEEPLPPQPWAIHPAQYGAALRALGLPKGHVLTVAEYCEYLCLPDSA